MPQTLSDGRRPIITSDFMRRFLDANQARYWSPPGTRGVVHNRCFIRKEAFNTYVRLKQAVRSGDLNESKRLRARLKDDPQFGGPAARQLNQAYLRRALDEARQKRATVRPCLSCKTPLAAEPNVPVRCGRCGSQVLIRSGARRRTGL